MRKLIPLLIVFLLIINSSKSQIQNGNFMAGADIANFRLSLNEGGTSSIRLEPKLAYFISNNIASDWSLRKELVKPLITVLGYWDVTTWARI
jgi:hypothetical protein